MSLASHYIGGAAGGGVRGTVSSAKEKKQKSGTFELNFINVQF